MNSTKIVEVTLYHINNNRIEKDSLQKEKATEYINTIIEKSIGNNNARYFKKQDEGLIDKITEYIKSDLKEDEFQYNVAKLLMEAEKKAQARIIKMNREIKKGSLIQAVLKDEGDNYIYILSKVEHVDILDKDQWEKHTGLPTEQEILKTCIVKYNQSIEIDEIKMFDTNKQISEYWSKGFMNSIPFTTDEDNTQKSFKEIDKFLAKNVKKNNPSDYLWLYNSLLAYYNQNIAFDYDDMINKVILSYRSQNISEEDLIKLVHKMNKIPDNKFDRQFNVSIDSIRSKKKKSFDLNGDIELIIKDNIENLRDIIIAERSDNDNMYIKIKVDSEMFEQFNFK